ncbi:MAG: hypothetical protein ACOC44_19635 [Promethearchaeia archaeon]
MINREFDKLVKYARTLKVEPINNSTGNIGDLYEVKGYVVRVFNKKGRKLITCECQNDVRNVKEPTICVHKLAVLNYILNNEKIQKARELKEDYDRMNDPDTLIKEVYQDYIDKLFDLILK